MRTGAQQQQKTHKSHSNKDWRSTNGFQQHRSEARNIGPTIGTFCQ